jgi:hypothetical protein
VRTGVAELRGVAVSGGVRDGVGVGGSGSTVGKLWIEADLSTNGM